MQNNREIMIIPQTIIVPTKSIIVASLIHHLIWKRTGSVDCSDHLGWIRTGSGGYGDLGIGNKKTNISVDVNLLTM